MKYISFLWQGDKASAYAANDLCIFHFFPDRVFFSLLLFLLSLFLRRRKRRIFFPRTRKKAKCAILRPFKPPWLQEKVMNGSSKYSQRGQTSIFNVQISSLSHFQGSLASRYFQWRVQWVEIRYIRFSFPAETLLPFTAYVHRLLGLTCIVSLVKRQGGGRKFTLIHQRIGSMPDSAEEKRRWP